jgi:hypothetical protein
MKSKEEKLKQQQLKKEFERKQQETFISELPMEVSNFHNLFDALNEYLENEPCDRRLTFTERFLNQHTLPLSDVVLWLNKYGGYCDCEVLFNVEEKFEKM